MEYKINGFRFEPGGGHNGAPKDTVWAQLNIHFTSDDNEEGKPHLKLAIPLNRDRGQTFGEQEQLVRDHARAILAEALRLLEQNSLADLADLGEAAKQAHQESFFEVKASD